jgi:tRNA threonylcarbamoyladenosine biosynthesis protein TsaB
MITLAIECATQTVSIALLDQEKILVDLYLDAGRGHSEVLLPALEKLFLMTGLTTERIGLLVCTTGPGSFTGVRIGVSTIKGLALATGKPIVGVSTLEALAMTVYPSRRLICPILDARKNQVYAGLYRLAPDGLPEAVAPDRLTEIDLLVKALAAEEVDFVGDLAVFDQKRLSEAAAPAYERHACRCSRLHASAVGLIGLRRYQNGRIEDPLTFFPTYLRSLGTP